MNDIYNPIFSTRLPTLPCFSLPSFCLTYFVLFIMPLLQLYVLHEQLAAPAVKSLINIIILIRWLFLYRYFNSSCSSEIKDLMSNLANFIYNTRASQNLNYYNFIIENRTLVKGISSHFNIKVAYKF